MHYCRVLSRVLQSTGMSTAEYWHETQCLVERKGAVLRNTGAIYKIYEVVKFFRNVDINMEFSNAYVETRKTISLLII